MGQGEERVQVDGYECGEERVNYYVGDVLVVVGGGDGDGFLEGLVLLLLDGNNGMGMAVVDCCGNMHCVPSEMPGRD